MFDYDAKKARLEEVVKLAEDPSLWDDPKKAQDIGRERKGLDGVVLVLDQVGQELSDTRELFELASAEDDEDTLNAVIADVGAIEAEVAGLEFRRMFANPADPNHCFLDIQAGAGGTEACDWASMLLRQYLKYAERKGFKVEVLEESEGEVAGIKSASLKISGDYAFGYLRSETGVHRLVRKDWRDGLLIFPTLTALAVMYANWRMVKVGRAGLFWSGQRTGGHALAPAQDIWAERWFQATNSLKFIIMNVHKQAKDGR